MPLPGQLALDVAVGAIACSVHCNAVQREDGAVLRHATQTCPYYDASCFIVLQVLAKIVPISAQEP